MKRIEVEEGLGIGLGGGSSGLFDCQCPGLKVSQLVGFSSEEGRLTA